MNNWSNQECQRRKEFGNSPLTIHFTFLFSVEFHCAASLPESSVDKLPHWRRASSLWWVFFYIALNAMMHRSNSSPLCTLSAPFRTEAPLPDPTGNVNRWAFHLHLAWGTVLSWRESLCPTWHLFSRLNWYEDTKVFSLLPQLRTLSHIKPME